MKPTRRATFGEALWRFRQFCFNYSPSCRETKVSSCVFETLTDTLLRHGKEYKVYFTASIFKFSTAQAVSPATLGLSHRQEFPCQSKASQYHRIVRAALKTFKSTIYAPTAVPLRSQRRAVQQTILLSLLKMCIAKLSKHAGCGHWSCSIEKPCKEGRDFSNCPSFVKGIARNAAKYPQELAKEKTCPKCDKKDDYDGKKIRMVKGTVHATKFGFGPSVS